MAMLRRSRAFDLRFITACVGTVALVMVVTASKTNAAEETAAPPRPLMRLPTWIESLNGRSAMRPAEPAKPVQQPLTPAALPATLLTGGWTEPVEKVPLQEAGQQETAATPESPQTLPEVAVEPPPALEISATEAAPAPPVASAPSDTPTVAIDPASFRGVYPGKTTREEIESAWGPGQEFVREDGTNGMFWKIEPFDRVEVSVGDGVVDSIRIKLIDPVAVKQLAEQLGIADVRRVSILDEQGISIGEVFPERGVAISVKPGTQSALAVILEPLDAEAFVLRGEGEIDESCALAVADLSYAVEIDPEQVRAQRLLIVLLSEQGRWQQALAVAAAAEALDPVDIWTQLKHASVLLALGRIDEAREKVVATKAQEGVSPLVTAQAARMLGRIELAARSPDYQKSVSHFEEAIRTATPLLTKDSESIRKAARDVLLDAHLGTSLAIAKGTWQQKSRVIPKWIARSEALISESNTTGQERNQLELTLCRGALAVAAGSAEGVETLPWVKRLLGAREKLGTAVKDPARRRQLDWEVGRGLADAVSGSLARGDSADMLENATLTAAYLERGSEQRQLTAVERREMGDILFSIGILHSLHKGDHATAVTWFDKTIPLWGDNQSFRNSGETGRLGESFVSMAISYWQVNRRDDALKLSREGIDLMVEAVDRKELDERALAVAYGNLSTMYAEEGDDEQSKNYAEMASRAEATGTTLR